MDTDRPVDVLPSPCISVCQMDPQDGVCVGCYRTRAEIAAWRSMSQDDQLVLLDILQDRRARRPVSRVGHPAVGPAGWRG